MSLNDAVWGNDVLGIVAPVIGTTSLKNLEDCIGGYSIVLNRRLILRSGSRGAERPADSRRDQVS